MIINQTIYDGSLLKEKFAYKFFRKDVSPYGNIIAFVAPMEVVTNLIDLEDSLENDFIYSDKAINFCWEIPGLCPLGAVAFQRLLNVGIASRLASCIDPNHKINVDGDDIMINATKKASVSITYSKDGVAIGHTGINIKAGPKAPDFAYSTLMSDTGAYLFMNDIINDFNEMVKDHFIATTKVIV